MLPLRRFIAALLVVFATVFGTPALAHPHVTVVAKVTLLLDDQGRITAIRHHWVFDEAYSAFATTGLATGPDGRTTEAALRDLAKLNVESLSEFAYFTALKDGKTAVSFKPPRDNYRLLHDGKALVLTFELPLASPLKPNTKTTLRVDDETFFVAFSFAETEPVVFGGTPQSKSACTIDVRRPKTAPTGDKLAELGEDFFSNLKSGFTDQYATTVHFACP